MRVTISLLASALLATVAAPAQTGAPQRTPGPDEQRTIDADRTAPPPTATVRYGADALRSGELRLPKGKGPFPVAILIHGGCFVAEMGGTGMQGFAEMLRARGFATWDIDYRRVGHAGGGWPGSFEDVAAGVDYLPTLAKRYPLDLSRVTTVGHSAGALFALWAASRPKLPAPWTPRAGRPPIRSAVAIDGPGTLASLVGPDVQVCGKPVIVPLMGGTPAERPKPYRIASAMDHLPLGVTQLLVFSELGPFMQPYAARARAAGDPVLTLSPPNADHFDIVTRGTPNGEAVADWVAANAFKTTR
ncbi:alpha/beta hydrolase fold [Sphingomonas guangdongensis]|uniref:Alpha/beta hydrolase fold n=1 Tax=Sphingomonas guangdongensis TaxID=1141890 RepID=A0A285QHJ1_9SPHN|nr:alpha/beta hydrolase [Sphingomonas guangdongensis]SOB80978.1 alpha/beta hydrolase fold [Sphingomonas guangdongensis]